MKKNIYNLLDEVTEQYVPDNFNSIMNEIKKIPASQAPTVYSFTEKKSTTKQWKYTVAAACICAVIATGAIISIPSQNNILQPQTPDYSQSVSDKQPSIPANAVLWNEGALLEEARLAGEFRAVTEEEWKAFFAVELPTEGKVNYFLVYEISKEDGITDNVMFGYVSVELTNDTGYSAYVSKGTLKLSPVLVDTSTLKESKIENKNVFLGTESNRQWAAFEQNGYSFIATMDGFTKENTVQLVEELIK